MKAIRRAVALILIVVFVITPVNVQAKGISTYQGVDYSAIYDYEFYKNTYSDLRASFGNRENLYIKHFVDYGMKEGRKGNSVFDVKSYMNAYPDLRNAFGKNLKSYYIHYLNYGRFEKRIPNGVTVLVKPTARYHGVDLSSVYDFEYYISHYPDLKAKYIQDDLGAIEHFVLKGVNEGRIGKADYDGNDYARLKAISKNIPGASNSYKGVALGSVYDYFYYVWNNKSVGEAYNYDSEKSLKHFAELGLNEGRRAKHSYNVEEYNRLKEAVKTVPLALLNMVNVINGHSSPTGYAIAVDKAGKQVGIFTGRKGSYGLLKSFPCAIGAQRSPTPNGVYHVGARGLYFNTGTRGRCWYYTQIRGNYLFHSQIYDRQNKPVNIIDNAMGSAVSHGCIRLYLEDAKWIYDNIPTGTTIVVY